LPTAIKSIRQFHSPEEEILTVMETFRQMVNDCLRIGLANDISTIRGSASYATMHLLATTSFLTTSCTLFQKQPAFSLTESSPSSEAILLEPRT
jgi:hypothetical protein